LLLTGCALSALSYFVIFPALLQSANPALVDAQKTTRVVVSADPTQCSFQGSPIAREIDFRSSCDVAKRALAQLFIPYENRPIAAGEPTTITLGDKTFTAPGAELNSAGAAFTSASAKAVADFRKDIGAAVKLADLSPPADPAKMNKSVVLLLLLALLVPMAMAYGPLAALLVELFPMRIRYTAMSLPYHLGNGWFGGLLPSMAFAMVAATGNIYQGLWYPVAVAGMTVVLGLLFLREPRGEISSSQ
jgi:hypothetical protein